ncbi:4'-phosphopantetheinyl transferase superfamily protein [Xanthobacter autotrophicus DSM 431]|uniref:4'-phosphopantetheinyl transferase family protein n=1 Tax=Xanthobacter nonsaccharivorans TaxID=3119912 RepID=UPI00372AC638
MTPLALPALAPGESLVAVARVEDMADCAVPLTAEDEARIARLVQARDRAARGAAWRLARLCLGSVLGRAPDAVAVRRGTNGRPALAEAGDLDFNLSHTTGWVAVGLMRGGRIGVDVERARSLSTWGHIAPEFLAAAPLAAWEALAEARRGAAALSAWCRKEAVLKATGEGLAQDARTVEVPLGGGLATLDRAGRRLTVATLATPAPDPQEACLAVAVEAGRLPLLLSRAAGGWSLAPARAD